jgi:hypothetical protein
MSLLFGHQQWYCFLQLYTIAVQNPFFNRAADIPAVKREEQAVKKVTGACSY